MYIAVGILLYCKTLPAEARVTNNKLTGGGDRINANIYCIINKQFSINNAVESGYAMSFL